MGSLTRRLRARVGGGGSEPGREPGESGRAPGPGPGSGPPALQPGKTFLLGLGAQKGGTTWLHRYLADSPQYANGYRKEYHVFDARHLESERWMRDRILEMAAEELEKARRGEPARADQLHRASMYANHDFYYDFFAGLLRKRPRFRVTADLTPDYGMLPADRVADIRRQFANRRIRTASVFLMREPVERVWSHIRMRDQREPDLFDVTAEEVVARDYADPHYECRTHYEDTLRVIDEVFGPEDRWVGFYEELFDEAPLREICELVGMDFHEPDLATRRNAYEKQDALPEDVVRTVARHYAGVYEAVAARFPDKDLERIWPSSRFVR